MCCSLPAERAEKGTRGTTSNARSQFRRTEPGGSRENIRPSDLPNHLWLGNSLGWLEPPPSGHDHSTKNSLAADPKDGACATARETSNVRRRHARVVLCRASLNRYRF